MKLYYTTGTCAFGPHILLEESGLPHTIESVSFKTKQTLSGADFNQINPNGYVPVLELDDGTRLTEAGVILQYIADQAPAKKLAPANGTIERYKLQSWLNFISTELHKSFSTLFNRAAADEWKDMARAHIAKRLAYVEQALAGKSFLTGENFTAADAYLFVVLGWTEPGKVDLSAFPNIKAFFERVGARPSVAAAKAKEAEQKAKASAS